MPSPDFTVATPPPGSAAGVDTLLAQNKVAGAGIQARKMLTLGQMNETFTRETMPQLQSGIAAAGQWYGSARQKAEGNAVRHQNDASNDVVLGATNALNDLTRQQTYASLGLII